MFGIGKVVTFYIDGGQQRAKIVAVLENNKYQLELFDGSKVIVLQEQIIGESL